MMCVRMKANKSCEHAHKGRRRQWRPKAVKNHAFQSYPAHISTQHNTTQHVNE